MDPAKIETIKDWASPKTPTEIRQFLVMKHVQSMLSSVTPVRRYGNPPSGYESYMLAVHSELPNSTQQNVSKPLGK
ncbi:hypothetical protein Tco_0528040 [Tanacetum coccineum]